MKTIHLKFDLEKFAPVIRLENSTVYAINKEKQVYRIDELEKDEKISCYYVDQNGNLTSDLRTFEACELINAVVEFIRP